MAQRRGPRWTISLSLSVACGLMLLLTAAAHTDETPHTDRAGMPLPKEAICRLGSVQLRPGDGISFVGFSRDGRTILCLANNKVLQFWDARAGKLRRRVDFTWEFHAIFALISGGKVLYFDGDRTCRTFDDTTGKLLSKSTLASARKKGNELAPVALISHDGALLARRDERGVVVLFDVATGKERRRMPLRVGPPPANRNFLIAGLTMAFTSDDATLAVVSEGNRIEFFETATGKHVGTLEAPFTKAVHHIDFSPDGKDLFCAVFEEQPVIVRGWAGQRDIVRLDGAKYGNRGAFAPSGRLLALAEWRTGVTFYDPATGKRIRSLKGAGGCSALAFSADSRTLLIAEGLGTLSTWDVTTCRRLNPAPEPPGSFSVIRFLKGGKEVLIYADRHLVLDARTGRILRPYSAIEPSWPLWTRFAPDGVTFQTLQEGLFRLYDARTGAELWKLGSSDVPCRNFLIAGRTFYVVVDGPIFHVWDLATRTKRRSWKGPAGLNAELLAISSDGRWLAAASGGQVVGANRNVYIWDTATGKLIRQYNPAGGAAYALAFAPNSDRLVVATDEPYRNGPRTIRLLDVQTVKEVATLAHVEDFLHHFVFSPDGRTLAVSDAPNSLRLWEVATGKVRHRFEGHRNRVDSLAFSSDGGRLAATSLDAPGYVWDVYGTHAVGVARAKGGYAAQHDRNWQDLADADAVRAFAAVRRLVQSPSPAITLLRGKLRPARAIGLARFRQLLRDLGSEDFSTRRRATEELDRLGDAAEGALEDARRQDNPVEVRRRIEALLGKLHGPTPERLRRARALEVLEQIGTSEAFALLDDLAGGAPEAALTREARGACTRLRRR